MVQVPCREQNITVETVQIYLAAAGMEYVDMAEDTIEAAMAVTEHICEGVAVSSLLTVNWRWRMKERVERSLSPALGIQSTSPCTLATPNTLERPKAA